MRLPQTSSILLLCLTGASWLSLSVPGGYVLAQLDTGETEAEGAGGGASEGRHSKRPKVGERVSSGTTFEVASVYRVIATTRWIRLECNLSDPSRLWAWVKDGVVVGTELSLTFRFNETDPFRVYYCVLQPEVTSGRIWAQQFVITDGLRVIERPLYGRFNGSHLVVNISSSEKVLPPVTSVTCTNTAIVNNGVLTNQSRAMQLAFKANRSWYMVTGPIVPTPDKGETLFHVSCTAEQSYGQEQRLRSEFVEIIPGASAEVSQVATAPFPLVPIIIGAIGSLLFLLLLVVLIRRAINRRARTQN